MTKDEAIEILENSCKGLARNEDFFKSRKEIMADTLESYAKCQISKKIEAKKDDIRVILENNYPDQFNNDTVIQEILNLVSQGN